MLNELVSNKEFYKLEAFLDKMFASLSVDIEFSRHFKDRVNDYRNLHDITAEDIVDLFYKEKQKYGKVLVNKPDEYQAVLKDLSNDLNIPFAINIDIDGDVELVAKTVMSKKNFRTSNDQYVVESFIESSLNAEEYLSHMTELMDSPVPYTDYRKKDFYSAIFHVEDVKYVFSATYFDTTWEIVFEGITEERGLSTGITGTGNEFIVFATIGDIFSAFIKNYSPDSFEFSAKEKSRRKLYDMFATNISKQFGYDLSTMLGLQELKYMFTKEQK